MNKSQKIIDFPYPVLRTKSESGYIEDCKFELEYVESMYNGSGYDITLLLNFNCETLSKVFNERKADLYLSYTTKIGKDTFKVGDVEEVKFGINDDILMDKDDILITVYLIANCPLELDWNEEMDEIFFIDEKYIIKKNDIMAISNTIDLSYNITGESIIRIASSEELDDKGFKIDISLDNYITIKIGKDFNKAYTILQKEKPIKSILNSSLVFNSIVYVLTELAIEGTESHKDKRWFSVIRDTFLKKGIDIEEFLLDNKEELDMDGIYEKTQIFMNNFFEKAVLASQKMVKSNED